MQTLYYSDTDFKVLGFTAQQVRWPLAYRVLNTLTVGKVWQ